MLFILSFIQTLFLVYSILVILKVISSWLPKLANSRIMGLVSVFTDPYLNFFRRFIPPIGGTLDISSLIAFIALRIIEKVLIYLVLWIHSLLA